MNSIERRGGSMPIGGPSTTSATASGTSSSGRSAPSATAIWASRSNAPVWLAVYADDRSDATVSMSAPGAPRAEMVAVAAPSARARSSVSDVYRFVPRWLSRIRPSAASGTRSVQRRVHRRHRPRLDARRAQEPGSDIRRVPARAGAHEEQPAAAEPLRRGLDGGRVGQHPAQLGGLRRHRLGHHAGHGRQSMSAPDTSRRAHTGRYRASSVAASVRWAGPVPITVARRRSTA